jgi:hypothetical protein
MQALEDYPSVSLCWLGTFLRFLSWCDKKLLLLASCHERDAC